MDKPATVKYFGTMCEWYRKGCKIDQEDILFCAALHNERDKVYCPRIRTPNHNG